MQPWNWRNKLQSLLGRQRSGFRSCSKSKSINELAGKHFNNLHFKELTIISKCKLITLELWLLKVIKSLIILNRDARYSKLTSKSWNIFFFFCSERHWVSITLQYRLVIEPGNYSETCDLSVTQFWAIENSYRFPNTATVRKIAKQKQEEVIRNSFTFVRFK